MTAEVTIKNPGGRYIIVDGPVDDARSLITYDVPIAPDDPKKSLRLRQKLGFSGPDTRDVDPNVRVVIDSFIKPRTWVDGNVQWVQHASPFPAARIDCSNTRSKLHRLSKELGARPTGICPVRSRLHSECFLEVIRQVTAECWERGLLLLRQFRERVEMQKSHRELFESRVGYAFRLALKGEKDTAAMVTQIESHKKRIVELQHEEETLKQNCEQLSKSAEEQLLVDEKRFNDEINALKKEATHKKNQLEALTQPVRK